MNNIAPKNLYFWVILQYFEGPAVAAAAASVEVTVTIRPAIRRTLISLTKRHPL